MEKLAFSPSGGSERRSSSAYLGKARALLCGPAGVESAACAASADGRGRHTAAGLLCACSHTPGSLGKTQTPVHLSGRPSIGGPTQNRFSPRGFLRPLTGRTQWVSTVSVPQKTQRRRMVKPLHSSQTTNHTPNPTGRAGVRRSMRSWCNAPGSTSREPVGPGPVRRLRKRTDRY